MKLSEIKAPKGARRKRKRVGCGQGSGHGKTSCRGHKGQKSRSGSKSRAWFEGGQMPLQRRLPKVGFNNRFRTVYQIVNLEDLARVSGEITPKTLKDAGLIGSSKEFVKILGMGEVSEALNVRVHAISASAAEKISKAGGKVEIVSKGASKKD
mgnify:CR=1 FL=1